MGIHIPYTPSQGAARVAWQLANGAGLSERQIRTLGQTHPDEMIQVMKHIADVRQDEYGLWSWHGKLVEPAKIARPLPKVCRKDRLARERAALVAFLFATRGVVRPAELCEQFGVSRQAAYRLLNVLSIVLPVYISDYGEWAVMEMREADV